MEKITQLDRDLFLWFNSLHAPWLDPLMMLLTKTQVWVPLYAVVAWLLYTKYKKNAAFILVGVAIAVTLADRITTGLMKPFFLRPRPSHEPDLQGLVHTVGGYYGGQYGFASSHAANVFAAALIIWWFLRSRFKYAWTIFLWSLFVSYTRIYLGVHYPGDVMAGGLVGILCGALGCYIAVLMIRKWGTATLQD